jgi:hypothetical protein
MKKVALVLGVSRFRVCTVLALRSQLCTVPSIRLSALPDHRSFGHAPGPLLHLPLEIGVEVPTKGCRRIIESELLVQAVNLLHVFRIKLEVSLQIRLDPARGLRFGDDGPPVRYAPRQRNLGAVLVVLLADLEERGIVDQFADALAGVVDLVLVAERRVLRDMDVVFLVEVGEGVLGKIRVYLDLMDGWGDGGGFKHVLQLGLGEVGDTNGLAFAVSDELFHCFVGLSRESVGMTFTVGGE